MDSLLRSDLHQTTEGEDRIYLPVTKLKRVMPDDQTSTLNPGKLSTPLAISGGWNVGVP